MRNFYYDGIRFKNGNLNIRFSPEEIANIKAGKHSDIEILSWKLDSFDTYFIGEQYCLSNYEIGCTLYSCYSDSVFLLNFSDIDKYLMNGKMLKLYAMRPTQDDREILKSMEV